MGKRWGRLVVVAVALATVAVASAAGATPTSTSPAPTATSPTAGQVAGARWLDQVFPDVTTTPDVVYGNAVDDQGHAVDLKMDVRTPTGDADTSRPALVIVHGGAFLGGDKEGMAGEGYNFASRGYVTAVIDYRLASSLPGGDDNPQFYAAVQNAAWDTMAAVRFLRAHAATYGIDPDHIGLFGSSAGAVASLIAAYTSENPGTSGTPGVSSAVQAVVSDSGAAGTQVQSAGDPPALLLAGTADTSVPITLPEQTCAAGLAAHIWCTLVVVPNGTHTAFFYDQAHNRPLTLDFLRAHLVVGDGTGALPFLDPVAFVVHQYPDFFGRAATPTDIATDADRIARGQTTSADLLASYESSTQVQAQLGAITRGYLAYLGRPPDRTGEAYWTKRVRAGATIASIDAAMADSREFARTSAVLSNQAFVTRLYTTILVRPPDPSGLAYWTGRLAHGLARRTLVASFAGRPEGTRATAPEVTLDIGTFAMLGRAPTSAERSTWLGPLRAGGTAAHDWFASLLASPAYAARITP